MPLEAMRELAKNIGCVHVDICDVTRTPTSYTPHETLVNQPVPEKALKGRPFDISAGYGAAKVVKKPTYHSAQKVGNSLAKFVVKYRSRRALQLFDLIPVTPEPQPLEERDVDMLNPQEMRQLLTRVREQGNQAVEQLAKIKQEVVQVKEEEDSSIRPRKRQSSTLSGEDDDECVLVEVKKRRVAQEEVEVLDLI